MFQRNKETEDDYHLPFLYRSFIFMWMGNLINTVNEESQLT